MEKESVAVFIDNSNLWIEGKKAYAASKNLQVEEDSRWRVDMGKLVGVVLHGRKCSQQPLLCGSIPPPVDSVWKCFEKQNIRVITFARSGYSGKEKQVDTTLVAQSVLDASQHAHSNHTIIFVSGDSDMKPGIDVALGLGVKVEVWSWRHSMSKTFQPKESLKLFCLDDHIDEIGSLEKKWKGSVSQLDSFPVLVLVKGMLLDHTVLSSWMAGLLYPCWTFQLQSDDLAIIFSVELEDDYLHAMVMNSQDGKVQLLHWIEYKKKYLQADKEPKVELNHLQSNPYFALSPSFNDSKKQKSKSVVPTVASENETKFERVGKKNSKKDLEENKVLNCSVY